MSGKTQTWTIARWSDRTTAVYVPINEPINGIYIDAFGRGVFRPSQGLETVRRVYKTDCGDSASYLMYDDDTNGAVPIIKIVEA